MKNIQGEKGGFQMKWLESLQTSQLIAEFYPEISISEKNQYSKKVGSILEHIEVEYEKHTWSLLKTHDEILNFIQEYNKQFSARLNSGSFMLQGLKQVSENIESHRWEIFLNFFQVTDLNENKIKTIRMLKKNGGRHIQNCCLNLNWLCWKERKFVINSEGVVYFEQENMKVKEYIPFNIEFQARKITETQKLSILLVSNHRNLLIKATNIYNYIQFLFFLKKGCKEAAQSTKNRFQSFAPERLKNYVDFKIDGQSYFGSLADTIQQAKEEIFIAGWWVSPQFYLKRPTEQKYEQFRLDRLLATAANMDVKIFILVYFQSSFLTNDSLHTKQHLEGLSKNIKVIRHPLGILPTLWSHHQKLVVIDQKIAFIGGFDLCYARYDDSNHRIDQNCEFKYPGIEYNNIRIKDLVEVKNYDQVSIDRSLPRLPWHDIGVQIHGQSVKDIAKHFVEYWNFANFQTHHHDRYTLTIKGKKQNKKNIIERKLDEGIQKIKNLATDFHNMIKKKNKDNSDKRMQYVDDDLNTPLPSETDKHSVAHKKLNHRVFTQIQRQFIPQKTTSQIAQIRNTDIILQSREFFQQKDKNIDDQKNFQKMVRRLTKIDEEEPQPHEDSEIQSLYDKEQANNYEGNLQNQEEQNSKFSQSFLCSTYIPNQFQFQSCQIVRSVSNWSIGCKQSNKQQSIQIAYLWLISNAKHHIYIQNQFFISGNQSSHKIKNQIAEALFQRVKKAIQNQQPFRIVVVMPLIPGFAGELDHPDAVIPRLVMKWQYKTINRNSHSLISRISRLTPYPQDYVQFFGLRQHGVINDIPHTEIVYVHSKLMIVDDQYAICGSANINDRSMQGSRDSEICVVVSGGKRLKISRNGQQVMVSSKVYQLRKKLWQQHFCLEDSLIQDPLKKATIRKIRQRAILNTDIYRKLFGCYPDDSIRTLNQLNLHKRQPTLEQYQSQIKGIIGNVVVLPLQFLSDQRLSEGSTIYPTNIST